MTTYRTLHYYEPPNKLVTIFASFSRSRKKNPKIKTIISHKIRSPYFSSLHLHFLTQPISDSIALILENCSSPYLFRIHSITLTRLSRVLNKSVNKLSSFIFFATDFHRYPQIFCFFYLCSSVFICG